MANGQAGALRGDRDADGWTAARPVGVFIETDGQAVPDCVRRVPGAGMAACGAIGAGTVPTVATSRAAAWPLAAFDLPGETPTAGRLRAFAGDGAAVGAFIRWQTGKRARCAAIETPTAGRLRGL